MANFLFRKEYFLYFALIGLSQNQSLTKYYFVITSVLPYRADLSMNTRSVP